ncbi:response regulator transcription factor [Halobacillus sp. ACCC02827]|uniref:response regulator transcription factor n=1 Tax=Bacillaceae TaxID=186817 RepID=UPI0002A509EB|nr:MULTISPECIES: response regulator transcription factor [Bacillaceae]ELK44891.1 winged helix family two component transcriptional regulator [Halobacillus sp. BAB-2008]QHT47076.1 response regulator transcription factor [Bacillus sp. SB49]WJE14304.1 response regulator transcription factor [Halobacillus sp. ACCC02827]
MAAILLVEDDKEIARIVKDHFTRQGMEVTWASTGQEGWEDFHDKAYDLILVDLMLPEMDGYSLCRNIRLKSDLPIVIISARQEEESKIKGLDLGADDYVTKPFSLMELTARVQSHLRRYDRYRNPEQELSRECLYSGELAVDVEKRTVKVAGKEVMLTAKEFAMLRLFIQHPLRTFTKAELYEHIWGEVELNGNNTINVHIKSLRNKLGENVKEPIWIETVWGTGYRFIGEVLS